MTATLTRTGCAAPELWAVGAPRVLAGLIPSRHTDAPRPAQVLDLPAHLATHGPLPGTDLSRLLALLHGPGIAGRGGAGYPLAGKVSALPGGRARGVVINGSESEPASWKDRTLLRSTPHLVLDGAAVLAAATAAASITVAVHDEASARAVGHALGQRPDLRHARVVRTSGRFVAGEARALVRSLAGGPALPPGQRDRHATDDAILVGNPETLAQLAVLVRLGTHRFAETGTRAEPGTTLLTVGGAVTRPGVVEVPIGTPLGIVLGGAGAADAAGVVIGGYHGAWLPARPDLVLSRAGLAAAGGTFGAGVVLVLDHATCALGELARVAGWLAAQSAGQCGPCRFGLPALAADVAGLLAGHPDAARRAATHARVIDGRGACRHPDGAVRFVVSGLAVLGDEIERHRRGGCGRPVLGRLPTGTEYGS